MAFESKVSMIKSLPTIDIYSENMRLMNSRVSFGLKFSNFASKTPFSIILTSSMSLTRLKRN